MSEWLMAHQGVSILIVALCVAGFFVWKHFHDAKVEAAEAKRANRGGHRTQPGEDKPDEPQRPTIE